MWPFTRKKKKETTIILDLNPIRPHHVYGVRSGRLQTQKPNTANIPKSSRYEEDESPTIPVFIPIPSFDFPSSSPSSTPDSGFSGFDGGSSGGGGASDSFDSGSSSSCDSSSAFDSGGSCDSGSGGGDSSF